MNKEKKPEQAEKKMEARLIRILAKDIDGDKKVYTGLTRVKGISWSFSNAVCKNLGIDKDRKIQDLSKEEIKKIEEFVEKNNLQDFLLNRRQDFYSGEQKHLVGSDLVLQKEFDIKRLKKIKSYKGIRHTLGLPVRGQRTKSHFRKNRKKSGAVGVRKVAKPSGGGKK